MAVLTGAISTISPIKEALESQEREIMELSNVIIQLDNRLAVVRNISPSNPNSNENVKSSDKLIENIIKHTNMIRKITEGIRITISELEI